MVEYQRLVEYIENYFPDPIYSRAEIEEWAQENVPAWDHINKGDRSDIMGDWEEFVAPQVEEMIESKSPKFWKRIKGFLGRLF